MEAESSQAGNRLFVILAVALIGLICIGLMGLSAVLFLVNSSRSQEDIAQLLTATPTPFPPTFTPTPTPTFTPTNTPEPTPTGTPVVRTEVDAQGGAGGTITDGGAGTGATATSTAIISGSATGVPADITTPTPQVVPGSGGVLPVASNGVLLWVSSGLLLALVLSGVWHRVSIVKKR